MLKDSGQAKQGKPPTSLLGPRVLSSASVCDANACTEGSWPPVQQLPALCSYQMIEK